MSEEERYVKVAEVAEGSAALPFAGTGELNMPEPLEFSQAVKRYFQAEYSYPGRDIVIHFFVTDYQKEHWQVDQLERWWLNDFAQALSAVAQEYFNATAPRIVAKYTPEVVSWWFKAQGYNHLIDRDAFVLGFLELLDETLHVSLSPRA